MIGNNKYLIKEALGEQVYDSVYEIIRYHRKRGTAEKDVYKEIGYMVNSNRELMA